MSDLLNSASLVLIPSGYKEDVVYSPVPTNGNGDLSFTRASNGTRINSAGLVEVCPWNLAQNSEDLSAGWILAAATIGANATTAPNGTSTADSFTSLATLANHVAYQLVTGVSGAYTFSAYVKKANSQYVYLKLVGNASDWVAAVFDLNDGTLTKSEATGWTGLTASSESVGNGWYRLIVSGSGATSVNFNVGIQYTNTGTPTFSAYADASFTGTGTIDYYIWGAQLNIGSTAKPYFPTTDRLNVPRLTYQNGGGGCPSLLLEKQSTNELTYSEQIQNAAWNVIGGDLVVTGNAVISPDGTQNAGAITLANSANRYFVHSILGLTGGVPYTYSVYMKSASGNLSVNMGGVNGLPQVMKTVTTEWQRFTYTFTPATSYGEYFGFDNRGAGSSTSGTLYFWGAQLEASSYPTSYIPTTSASATRVADAGTTSLSGAIVNASEGVLFLDYQPLNIIDSFPVDFQLQYNGGNSINGVTIYHSGDTPSVTIRSGGNLIFSASLTATTAGTRNKIALAYKASDFAVYQNGVQKATQSSGIAPAALNELRLSDGSRNFSINQAIVFPTRLTNAELASLTTI